MRTYWRSNEYGQLFKIIWKNILLLDKMLDIQLLFTQDNTEPEKISLRSDNNRPYIWNMTCNITFDWDHIQHPLVHLVIVEIIIHNDSLSRCFVTVRIVEWYSIKQSNQMNNEIFIAIRLSFIINMRSNFPKKKIKSTQIVKPHAVRQCNK